MGTGPALVTVGAPDMAARMRSRISDASATSVSRSRMANSSPPKTTHHVGLADAALQTIGHRHESLVTDIEVVPSAALGASG
jgi:hypothetical protein